MPEMPLLLRTKPHGEHSVYLVEDSAMSQQRIYELHDSRGNATPLLGSEMDSLCEWWTAERSRRVGSATL